MTAGLLPEGFLQCKTAAPPEDVKKIVVPAVDPVILKVAAAPRPPLLAFWISGVPTNCRLAANTGDGLVIMANARNADTANKVIGEAFLIAMS